MPWFTGGVHTMVARSSMSTFVTMKRFLLYLALVPFALMASAQSQGDLDVEHFKAALEKNDALLIDVRTPDEFVQGHIEAAANVDWNGGSFLQDLSGINKSEPVLLYCASGNRSRKALDALKKFGFTDVQHLKGGIVAWEKQGEPVITQ